MWMSKVVGYVSKACRVCVGVEGLLCGCGCRRLVGVWVSKGL